MSRILHDSFAKDWMQEFLSDFGTVQTEYAISGEVRHVDVYFEPDLTKLTTAPTADWTQSIGIFGRIAQAPCLIEPFRNPIPIAEIANCTDKSTILGLNLTRQAKAEQRRKKRPCRFVDRPFLWMISPTVSAAILEGFGAAITPEWGPGIHFLPTHHRAAIIAIHQLPRTLDTLWLRLLGRGTVQQQAIQSIQSLPKNHPYRLITLRHVAVLQKNLKARQNLSKDLQEITMALSITYEQIEAELLAQGREEGQKMQALSLVLRQLNRRLGDDSVPETDRAAIEQLDLPQLENLSEDLLDFTQPTDLTNWLANNSSS